MNPGARSPEKAQAGRIEGGTQESTQPAERRERRTHKAPVHLPHPVSHVGHHVVEQAERIPRHFLDNGEGERTTVTVGSRAARQRGLLSSSTTLSRLQACVHTHTHNAGLNMSRMRSTWDAVTLTYTKCDPVTFRTALNLLFQEWAMIFLAVF